jgi:hypothetical protein
MKFTACYTVYVGFCSGSANLKQSVYEDMHSGSTPTGTCRTPSAETEGKSFLTNQTRVTGVQDVITRMKNADQGEAVFEKPIISVFVLVVTF